MPRQPRTPDGERGRDRQSSRDDAGELDDASSERTQRPPQGTGDDRTQVIRQGSQDDSREAPPKELVGYGRSRDSDDVPRYLQNREQESDWDEQGYADVGGQDQWDREPRRESPEPGGRPPGGPPPGGPPRRKKRPRYGLRRFLVLLLVLILLYVGSMIWAVTSVWNSVDRVDATPTNSNRPAAGSGTNFLMVGTDSREDMDRERRNELVAGHDIESVRADTIMLLHLPDSGGPVLISIPRDSYVEIPGHGENKINTAYNIGGPPLLVDTVEQSTGLRVDGYLEIGFSGFVDVVDIVDGVEMCLDEPVQDDMTRLDLDAGCQDLIGAEALNYVRMRYNDPMGDLGRVERQREFLSSLIGDIATPGNVLLPWRLNSVGTEVGSTLTLGEDTSMWETVRMAWAMRQLSGGGGHSLTVPIADPNFASAVGSAVLWDDAEATRLFDDLNNGRSLTVDP